MMLVPTVYVVLILNKLVICGKYTLKNRIIFNNYSVWRLIYADSEANDVILEPVSKEEFKIYWESSIETFNEFFKPCKLQDDAMVFNQTYTNDKLRVGITALKYFVVGAMTSSPRRFRYWNFNVPSESGIAIRIEVGLDHISDFRLKILNKRALQFEEIVIDQDDISEAVIDKLQYIGGTEVLSEINNAMNFISKDIMECISSPRLKPGFGPGHFYFEDEDTS